MTLQDLSKAIEGAKVRIEATGYYLSQMEPDTINRIMLNSPRLTAKIVMVDPLPGKAICQRQYDEDNVSRNYSKIIQKVQEFRQKCRSLIDDERLKVGLIDAYPTMSVTIVDDDLYAYFYPYKSLGTESHLGPGGPVLKFSNYTRNAQAKFFENHLNHVFNGIKFLSGDGDYDRYRNAPLKDPCFK